MAETPEGDQLTSQHYRQQLDIRARGASEALDLWGLLGPQDLQATWPTVQTQSLRLLQDYRTESARAAVDYYQALRTADGYGPLPALAPTPPMPVDDITTSLRLAGPIAVQSAVSVGIDTATAMQSALVHWTGEMLRWLLVGGRTFLLNQTVNDHKAKGFQRVASGRACAFCAMLASRGPVYRSRMSAKYKKTGGLYHRQCSCSIEPVWSTTAKLPPSSQVYRDLWHDSTVGFSGDAALNAFRRALGHN
ncbi:hypothetical protein Lfu02_55020 [Longispora fulva]|uniref:MuF-like minor capsid protein n=1 Tax=Longispora fulva TaxID=619741 RepID=A0A8J7GGJ2_9ACTN|nr:hypothetical protein [Longispora fulva]MBG6137516.1 hypothetical protein [Longispora fulva]GIG61130.1 hypothetical protein Lfu02_55020 [Longispora fulva]